LILNDTSDKNLPKVDSTLSKGLSVLEVLSRFPGGMGVTDLSRELQMTKSNAFRLLKTLSILGYVQANENKRYCVTMKVWQLGQRVIDHLDLPKIAAPQLLELAQQTDETVYLAVRDGLTVIYIDKIESTKPIRSFTAKGGSAPIHCVGTGKALLAEEYDLLREQVRDQLTQFTPITITELKVLDEDMAATLKRGYAVDKGEYRDRIHSFGSVIKLPTGQAIGALGVSVPDVNLDKKREKEICKAVKIAAAAVSVTLANS
jgi:IclR family transcriptional regulator, KDG regulon repressor